MLTYGRLFLEKLMLALRDGRKLIGVLRSWDQFGMLLDPSAVMLRCRLGLRQGRRERVNNARAANLVLQSTTERIFVTLPSTSSGSGTSPDPSQQQQQPRGLYADVPHGIFLVRGENVLLLGEVDLDREDVPPRGYERGEVDVVKRMAEEQKKADRGREKRRLGKLAGLGFEGEGLGDMVL